MKDKTTKLNSINNFKMKDKKTKLNFISEIK